MLLYGLKKKIFLSDHSVLPPALPAVARASFSFLCPVCNPRQWESAGKHGNETAFSGFLLSPHTLTWLFTANVMDCTDSYKITLLILIIFPDRCR